MAHDAYQIHGSVELRESLQHEFAARPSHTNHANHESRQHLDEIWLGERQIDQGHEIMDSKSLHRHLELNDEQLHLVFSLLPGVHKLLP
jgi:hypothetical protein